MGRSSRITFRTRLLFSSRIKLGAKAGSFRLDIVL
jgi:hypothetical protein